MKRRWNRASVGRWGAWMFVVSWLVLGLVGVELMGPGGCGCGGGRLLAMQPSAARVKEQAGERRESEKPPVEDLSLPAEEYVKLGVPAATKVWNGDDCLEAARVLKSLAQTNPEKLPRYQSERSGELFSRMTSTKNLEAFRNRQVAFPERFPQILGYYDGISQIFKVYLTAFQAQRVSDSDVLELMGNLTQASVVILDVVDELIPMIDKNDPKYEVRMQGLNQMRNGLAQCSCFEHSTIEQQLMGLNRLTRLAMCLQEAGDVACDRRVRFKRQTNLLKT